jgi:hypothetical protein
LGGGLVMKSNNQNDERVLSEVYKYGYQSRIIISFLLAIDIFYKIIFLKLDELNINEIEVIDLDGGGCVALTALGAIKAGYKVTVNSNAIATMFTKKAEKYNKKLKKLGAEFI